MTELRDWDEWRLYEAEPATALTAEDIHSNCKCIAVIVLPQTFET